MDSIPCSSNRVPPSDKDGKLFVRRSTKELVSIIAECKGSKMVENLNEVFDILEDKLGMMCRVMTSLMCNDSLSKVFSPSEVLRRVVDDCQSVNSLMQFQKLKLAQMRHDIPITMSTADAMKEQSLMRKLVSAKRKLPVSPWMNIEPDKKKRKIYDMMIENVYRSVYRELLLYPSSILKLSDFVAKMRAMPSPNKFSDDQIPFMLSELTRRRLIHGFPIEDGNDVLIIKEMSILCIEPHMKRFSVTLEDYMGANIPKTLADLKALFDDEEKPLIEQIDNALWALVANLIIATVVRDTGTHVWHDEFPGNLPQSVMKAVTTLTQVGFLEMCDNVDRPVMKFVKKVNNVTLDKLGRVFGHPITCILDVTKDS